MLGPREKYFRLKKFLRIPVRKKRHRDRMEDREDRRRLDRIVREKSWQELQDLVGDQEVIYPRVLQALRKTYLKGQKVEAHKRRK